MPKTMIRPSAIVPDEFEPDWFAELVESLGEPLACELDDPPVRTPNSWLDGAKHGEYGSEPPVSSRHRCGRKLPERK